MHTRLSIVLTGLLVLTLGCFGRGDPKPDPETGTTTDDSVTDDSVADDSSSTDDTSYGEDFEPEEPSFIVTLDGGPWKATGGYYFANSTSYLKAEVAGEPTYTVDIEVSGDIRYAGTYSVASIGFSELASSTEPVIAKDFDPDMSFTVEGFANETDVFGTLDGTATLSGGGDHTITGGVIRNWPKY